MDCDKKSLHFVIDENLSFKIQYHKTHVNDLFGVTVSLENTQQNKRWVNLKGPEEHLSRAKEYVLALVHPEIITSMGNVLGNPLFTEVIQNDIERKSSAVLSRYDDQSDKILHIQGTALSVTVAKSLIDEVFCQSSLSLTNGISSLNEQVMVSDDKEGYEEVDDWIIVEDIPAVDPKGSTLAEPQVDRLNKMFKNHLGSALKPSKPKDKSETQEVRPISGNTHMLQGSRLKDGGTASTLSPHGREQQAYLRHMAQALKHDKDAVEEALSRFDMNDIILPANFIDIVENISLDKAKKSKQVLPSVSNNIGSVQGLDVSVISIDSSDEETHVMRPFGHVDEPRRHADLNNTIVLSSDDEQENEKPQTIKSKQEKQANKTEDRSQKKSDSFVVKGPPVSALELYVNQPCARNKDPKSALKSLQGNLTSKNSTEGLMAGNIDMDCSSSGANSEQSDPMHLRQEYVDGLMRTSPKGPKRGPRYIVIDGSNVAMCHGNHAHFSVPGIEICIKYFLSRGHNNITAFVPEWRRYANQISLPGKALLEKLNKAGFVKFTPARRVGNQTIASYDDRFILNLAVEEEGIIVSNDQYRDLQGERASYKDVVTNRLLQFTFVGNLFMPPDDPMGRFGPSLDQFLRHPEQPRRPGMATVGASSALPRTSKDGTKPRALCREKSDTNHLLPSRSEADTEKLFLELIKVFPEPTQKACVRKVLENHKQEVDLNRLSLYCINVMTTT